MENYENVLKTMRENLKVFKQERDRFCDLSEDIGIFSDIDKQTKRLYGDITLVWEASIAVMERIHNEEDEKEYDSLLRPLTNLSRRYLEQLDLLYQVYEQRDIKLRREKEFKGYKKELTRDDIRRFRSCR